MSAAFRLCLLLALGVAAPAVAQSPGAREQMRLQMQTDLLRAQQDLAARQAVIQQNDISRLDAPLRSERALATLRAQSYSPQVAPPAGGTYPQIDVGGLASIPDDRLAASNARAKAAADNRP
jgi:hypothetical protein